MMKICINVAMGIYLKVRLPFSGEELHLPLSVFANFALAPNHFAFILNRKKCRPSDSDDIKRMPLK